jgi:two-component system invasion response regulator UvrY
MLRVIIADDHVLIREGLREVLAREADLEVIGEAADCDALMSLVESKAADVVLMDVNMPGDGAVDTLQRIRGRRPNLRVLVLSMLPEEQVALTFLKLGAAGYVSKEAAVEELVSAIRKVTAGRPYMSAALAKRVAGAETAHHKLLSPRELQVLRLIAGGLAIKEIAGRLALSSSTVHTYRAQILRKLQLRSDVDLSRYALRHRLVDE